MTCVASHLVRHYTAVYMLVWPATGCDMGVDGAGQERLGNAFRMGWANAGKPVDGWPDEMVLRALVVRAKQDWPDLELDDEHFLRIVGHKASLSGPADVPQWLQSLQIGDLYLATGCAGGNERALGLFEQHFGPELNKLVARFRNQRYSREDMLQTWRERVLVADSDGKVRIAEYSGRGKLKNWVRVCSLRLFIDLYRKTKSQSDEVLPFSDWDWADTPDKSIDPELDFLKSKYRQVFKRAFEKALAALSSNQRNLLRLHLIGKLSIDQLGELYHIHRATAARKLVKIRSCLFTQTRLELMRDLSIDKEEFESLMRLIESNLDMSIARMLGSHLE